MISAIVLAAGQATRFGSTKVVASLSGVALVRHVVDRLQLSSVDELLVVAGNEIDEIQLALTGTRARVVQNPHPSLGQSESVRIGVQSVGQEADAFLIALGDQPLIDPDVIDRMIAAWRSGLGKIVMPIYRGERGNPVLFDRSLRSELMKLDGDQGARPLFNAYAEVVHRLPIDAPAPRDVDTPDDLRAMEPRPGGK